MLTFDLLFSTTDTFNIEHKMLLNSLFSKIDNLFNFLFNIYLTKEFISSKAAEPRNPRNLLRTAHFPVNKYDKII